MPTAKPTPDVTVDGDTQITNIPEGVDNSDPGVKAYLEKMAAKADQGTKTSTDAQEPELLAGKFKSRDDLLKSINELSYKDMSDEELVAKYKELESRIGQQSDNDSGDPTDDPGVENTDDSDDTVNDKGDTDDKNKDDGVKDDDEDKPTKLTPDLIANFNRELAENGKLSEESFKQLEDFGITRDMVNAMVYGVQAQMKELHSHAGGQELYNKMVAWAENNLSESEVAVYNEAFISGDMGRMKDAIDLLKLKYGRHNTIPPKNKVKPSGTGNTTVQGYSSKAEMKADMQDPRYQRDPKFRKTVEQKIAKTTWF